MKRFAGLFIAVLMICCFSVLPVFAEEGVRVPISPDENGDIISDGAGGYTIVDKCDVESLKVMNKTSVTIAENITVTVKKELCISENSTVKILGKVVLASGCTVENAGKLNIMCCGEIEGGVDIPGKVVSPVHKFDENMKCVYCLNECKHENVMSFCMDCGAVLQNDASAEGISFNLQKGSTVGTVGAPYSVTPNPGIRTVAGEPEGMGGNQIRVNIGSVLSDGNMAIIVSVACLAVLIATICILRKKKSAFADAAENKEKTEE